MRMGKVVEDGSVGGAYRDGAFNWLHIAFVDEYFLCLGAQGFDLSLSQWLALQ